MRVKNIITNEEKDLPNNEAKRWVESCTPWYSEKWHPKAAALEKDKQNTITTNYDLPNIDPESIHQFWNYCLSCTRSVLCARTIKGLLERYNTVTPSLSLVINNSYAVAVLEWSKGFGSNSEEYHWKKVFGEGSGFIQEIWQKVGISEGDYLKYWAQMSDARVSAVAHSGLPKNPDPILPDFNLAIDIFTATHEILIQVLNDLSKLRKPEIFLLEPMGFDVWMNNLQESFESTFAPAVQASL